MTSTSLQYMASAPRGLADLLVRELTGFGATDVRERSTGAAFQGPLESAYRACLWSRVANRIFLQLAELDVQTADQFYAAVREVRWSEHLGPGATLACDFTGRHPTITHTHFGALKLKDGIVDALRAESGFRPDISVDRPSVRIHAHAQGTRITISVDLSGESLHRRGYRGEAGEAPLKENVAAGILLRAGWQELAAAGAEFLDPMCGSGTFPIEAAMIACDLAPGLLREYFGFSGWRGHDEALWRRLREEATARKRIDSLTGMIIRGEDLDASAIRSARANAQRAGVAELVQLNVRPLEQAAPLRAADASDIAAAHPSGLLCTNPPYGVRLEGRETARKLHRELGRVLRERFQGWQAAVLTGAPELGLELGLRAHRTHVVWNGALECRLLRLRVDPENVRSPGRPSGGALIDTSLRDTPGAQMFANRMAKNLKRLKSWARSREVSCYRMYDADMPEYALAIDLYRTVDDGLHWLYVQEYAAPASIDPEAAKRRRNEALSVLPDVAGVPAERIRMRLRRVRARGEQYRKLNEQAQYHVVEEGGLKFRVNFDDYLDTGLFLDHRMTRARLRDAAAGKRFLNLFAYTGTATVYAAAGGARASTSVDLSRTYLDWARRNLELNGFTSRDHIVEQADCREWLDSAARRRERYGLIFLDPPTFSNSKRMQGVLDIQRDHTALIDACAALLVPQGMLVFSTNAQRFKLDEQLQERYQIRDISRQTLPEDFARNPRIHSCFEITMPAARS